MEPLRDIEGPLWHDVNSIFLSKERKRTTHIRLILETKNIIDYMAKREEMTIPQYMKKMVKEYRDLPW